MKDKEIVQIKTRSIFHLLLVKDADVLLAHRLFSLIYNVAWYNNQVRTALTPEATSLARWSLEDARKELDKTLLSMNLFYLDKVLIRYVANHYEFDEI